jgi:erlin
MNSYFFGGAILDGIAHPGFHWKFPLASVVNVQTTMQTDRVRNIPCGTSGGVLIEFCTSHLLS